MNTPVEPGRWSARIEDDIYRDVVTRFAPHLPLERVAPRRPAATPAEIAGICDNWIWTAGHDSLIVQAASRALDPIRQINDIVRQHWHALDDLPYRDIHSFFAWELHYELHILSRLHTERRTGQIGDPSIKQFAEERVTPDEEVHRLRILDWWLGYYGALGLAERGAVARKVLALDDELQRRLNPYLNSRYERSATNLGTDVRGKDAVYDNFRREVVARLLDLPPEGIGRLTSLAD